MVKHRYASKKSKLKFCSEKMDPDYTYNRDDGREFNVMLIDWEG